MNVKCVHVNVGVHMGICVWALTVRKYDCICVRVVNLKAHCMCEHECVCCSVPKSCLTLCDPMEGSMSGFPVLHYLPEFAQTYIH